MKPNRYRVPGNLSEAMERFYRDFPPSKPVGFIIMRFGKTPEHYEIQAVLEEVSEETKVPLIRADYETYHSNLFENVRIYLYGCSFGIAVFEDAEEKGFNPNVSLEVGYLLALGKPVLLLKSSSLSQMPTDIMSELYYSYNANSRSNARTKNHILKWISQNVNVTKTNNDATTSISSVSQLLRELYPGIPVQKDNDHLSRHVDGLLQYKYRTIGSVRNLLKLTEDARAWVNLNCLPDFATCAISHALALYHPEYTDKDFWTGSTAKRLREARRLFPELDNPIVNE